MSRWIQHHGPDHYEVAVVWHNLGGIEAAQGHQKAAINAYKRALEIKEAVLGPQHPEVRILGNMLTALNSADVAAGQAS